MNVFYAPLQQIGEQIIELRNQEAVHASKVLRYREGDGITVVDGEGGWYEGVIKYITEGSVQIAIHNHIIQKRVQPDIILGMGIIKKRDRLEFAVEKAVEIGVKEVALFRSEYTVKQNVRLDRLHTTAVSAMKQSLQAWLPKVTMFKSLDRVIRHYTCDNIIVARQSEDGGFRSSLKHNALLLVGPEGGFSDGEINHLKERENVTFISLGEHRLRAETAVIIALSQYHFV
jgi:16S rRNA (uracil1498-N3)-methyltransferase